MIQKPRSYSFILIGAVLTAGCGNPVQETAAHKIADALPRVLGPAAHYDVQVNGDPFALTRGRARAVHIQGEGVQLSPTLTLDTLDINAKDIAFDPKNRKLTHIGETTFTASLGQTNLDRCLAASKPLLPGLVVTLLPDKVEAHVPVTFLGLQTTAALAGSFRPNADDPSKLDFMTSGAQLGSVPLPAGLINLATESVNPVIDLSGLKAPLTVTDSSVTDSRIILSGTASLQDLVQP